jgi:hypothetical protein
MRFIMPVIAQRIGRRWCSLRAKFEQNYAERAKIANENCAFPS